MYILCKPISRAFFTRSGARLPTEAEPSNCRSSPSRAIDHAGGLSPTDQPQFQVTLPDIARPVAIAVVALASQLVFVIVCFFEPIERGSG